MTVTELLDEIGNGKLHTVRDKHGNVEKCFFAHNHNRPVPLDVFNAARGRLVEQVNNVWAVNPEKRNAGIFS